MLPFVWIGDLHRVYVSIQKHSLAAAAAGIDPKVSTYKFCTNGSASAGIHHIPTIGFGPCAESQAHVVDEYVEIAELENAAKGYYNLIDALCRM